MKKLLSRSYIFIVFLFLYAPILLLIFFSFNSSNSNVVFEGFSLRWYEELFRDEEILRALLNTLIIAFSASVISTVIGTAAAIGLANFKKWKKKAVMNITYIPVLNPDIITGISLLLLFVAFSVPGGFLTVLIAHITFDIPYVILAVTPRLRHVDSHLFEAAQDLGAPPVSAFFKAVFPQLVPGIISAFLMAFTLSIDDFVVTFFVKGNAFSTLSTVIYTITKKRIPLSINALCAIMLLCVLAVLVAVNIFDKKKSKEEFR